MSWMSENYHKAALGGGVAILAAVGYLSWSSATAKQDNLVNSSTGSGADDASSAGGEIADELIASLKNTNPLEAAQTTKGRPVDLFNSVDLFVKNGDVSKLIDLLQLDYEVHPGIPNKWWVDNRVDPSFSDSPMRDKDGDGFFNGEEQAAGTDPSDPKSYGLLASKLEVETIDSQWWLVLLNSGFGNGNYQFRYQNEKGENSRMRATQSVKAGQVFFPEGPAAGRFKAVEEGKRMVEGANGRQVEEKYYIIEDLADHKAGQKYEAPYRPRKENEPLYYQFDNTVTFILNAVGQADQKHTVKENESFTVKVDGKNLTYKLVKVDMGARPNTEPKAVHVEYTDASGVKKVRVINL
ncbi:MAG: Amuc_1099 family pilus-like system protein [Akkermansiaceae bacterium]